MFEEKRDLLTRDAAEYEDRRRDALAPQKDAFLQEGHAEIVCAAFDHVTCHWHEAVPIGVCFQDGHDPGTTDMATDGGQVLRELAQVHLDVSRAYGVVIRADGGRRHAAPMIRASLREGKTVF